MGRGSCGAGRSLSTAPPLPGSVLAPGNPYLGNQVRTCPGGKQRHRRVPAESADGQFEVDHGAPQEITRSRPLGSCLGNATSDRS
jgi:hypothetical protein